LNINDNIFAIEKINNLSFVFTIGLNTFFLEFIDKNTVIPVNIINKWSIEFVIEEIEWGLVFSESFSLSKNNKLSCFQYKLIHRVLALNPYLFMCKIKETELCSLCNEAKETHSSLFVYFDQVSHL
jgi:hypothetical protein